MERFLASAATRPSGTGHASKRFVIAEDPSAANPSFCYALRERDLYSLVSGTTGLGAVVIARRGTHAFRKDELTLGRLRAEVAANTVRSLHLSEELNRSTSSDPLTGASNQRHFHAMVEQGIVAGRGVTKNRLG